MALIETAELVKRYPSVTALDSLSLEIELETDEARPFDLLAVDAFSGDAIPVHLLTREAFELCFQHLHPDALWRSMSVICVST